MIGQTQQDVLDTVQQMIDNYNYHTKQRNNTSCDTTYIIEIKNDTIVGCVGIKKNTIMHLRVKKNSRRGRIGTSLIIRAENIIKKRSYFETSVFVHRDNEPAINLFSKNGYFLVNTWRHCYHLKKFILIGEHSGIT